MNIAMFYHSLVSDWNHGNAHFLRGIATELQAKGHVVSIYEPKNSWSCTNLIKDYGTLPIEEFERAYPTLQSRRYDERTIDLDRELAGADLVIVHEWNEAELIKKIGEHRRRQSGYKLLFHDTHHRASSAPESVSKIGDYGYDGVLTFGETLRALYLEKGWIDRAWTWHEAADVRVFRPLPPLEKQGDLVWIGNWGDDERSAELGEFLFEPVHALGLKTRIYGVRYPAHALRTIAEAGIDFAGWLPNYKVPLTYSQFTFTVHIPRRPYTQTLSGIPTIRIFEACACGIPLISSPWDDCEQLFTPGKDFLIAQSGEEMKRHLRTLLGEPALRHELATHARHTILKRHTCGHRVDQLMNICKELMAPSGRRPDQTAAKADRHSQERV